MSTAITIGRIRRETQDPLVLGYLIRVLQERKFQKNPARFVERWERKRGTTEELRIPEDRALAILKKLVTED